MSSCAVKQFPLFVQKIRRILLLFIFIWPFDALFAQASGLWPTHPKAGDTLHIQYRLKDSKALLHPQEAVYAKLTACMQDGAYRWHILSLTGKDTLMQTFVLPAGTASFNVRFYTLQKDDERAAIKRYVYDPNTGKPVAGAYWEDFFGNDPQALFEKETMRHPAHYLTYAKYFNVISQVIDGAEHKKIMAGHLAALEKIARLQRVASQIDNTPDPGLLAALCVGYAKMGQLPQARNSLLQLFRYFPERAETAVAFSLYNYENYKATALPIEEDIRQQLVRIVKVYPAAALLDDANVGWHLSEAPQVSVSDLEKALLPRYAAGTMPYYALGRLPELYLKKLVKLDSAKAMLERAILSWLSGSIQHQHRLSASHYTQYLPSLMETLAAVHLQLKEYPAAITQATAAMNLLQGSNFEGNLLPGLLSIRARAFQKAGNLNAALEDYKRLYRQGKEDAMDSMRSLYPYCQVKQRTVEELAAAVRNNTGVTGDKKLLAPAFSGVDLQGRIVTLADLRGKVIVLNFWSIGCAPCIGEMPALNKLVEKYRESDQVVFLAITQDETKKLQPFLRQRRFLYTVVNQVGNMEADYQVVSLPVHIIIGKDGTVVNRSIGARHDMVAYLDALIQGQL